MGRKSKEWHNKNQPRQAEVNTNVFGGILPDEKHFDEPSSDESAEDPTELVVKGELNITEPLPPGRVELIPDVTCAHEAQWVLLNNLFEQIDCLERGKIGTWQAAFEIVREIRKLRD